MTTRELATPREDPLTATSGRPSERGRSDGTQMIPGPDQPQSSRTPTPLPYDAPYGAGVGPSESPVPAPPCKGPMIIAQHLPWETWRGLPRVCWTAGYLLRGLWLCGTPAAANVFLLCGHHSVSPHTALETCPARACGQKTTLRAPRCGLPEPSAPHRKSQSGSGADWRSPTSGDQKGDGRPGLPTEERATQRARKSSVWVRVATHSKKGWHTGAV